MEGKWKAGGEGKHLVPTVKIYRNMLCWAPG